MGNDFFFNFNNKKRKIRRIKSSDKQRKPRTYRKASCKYRLSRFEKHQLVSLLAVVIRKRFPELLNQIAALPDYRKRPFYEVKELVISGLMMFLFKQKSRNQADNTSKNLDFQDNIKKIFGIKLASLDTVNEYLKFLPADNLERIKQEMLREIIKSKVFQKYKYKSKYFLIAIDGTGIHKYDYEPYPGCPFKEYSSGKKIWTAYALEAKLVTKNGFAISVITEWVENRDDGSFEKQDCELNAFKRLIQRLKKEFPRLEIMLLMDGLYPNKSVFDICEKYNWKYAITLKDNSLKSVQEQIADQVLFKEYSQDTHIEAISTHWIKEEYKLFKNMEYQGYNLRVIETIKEQTPKKDLKGKTSLTRFVHITNVDLELRDVHQFSRSARLRWKIENEGFNNQKRSDYELEHKFSRTSFNAIKNYYELLQIAHAINQFTYKLNWVKSFLKEYDLTVKSLILDILSYLKTLDTDIEILNNISCLKNQLRY